MMPVEARPSFASDPFAAPAGVVRRGRAAKIVGGCTAALALAGAIAFTLTGGVRLHTRAAAKSVTPAPQVEMPAAPATVAAAAVEAPAPAGTFEVDDIPAPPPSTAALAATGATEQASSKVPTNPKKRFGRLTIKGEARYKNVWFDGKRMLGTGTRSFLVFCGMHTIAVNEKSESKDIEVPCNGEFAVAK
jgi:hypothetical protein